MIYCLRFFSISYEQFTKCSLVCLFDCLWNSLSRSSVQRKFFVSEKFMNVHELSIIVSKFELQKSLSSSIFCISFKQLSMISAITLRPALQKGKLHHWRCNFANWPVLWHHLSPNAIQHINILLVPTSPNNCKMCSLCIIGVAIRCTTRWCR